MDVREKLVELLNNSFAEQYEKRGLLTAPHTATDLIAHGVTVQDNTEISEELLKQLRNAPITILQEEPTIEVVQEWISVKDRFPPYNHDVLVYRPNMAMKIMVDSYNGYYGEDDNEWYEGWAKYGKDIHNNPLITHWAYLPQPPKGE